MHFLTNLKVRNKLLLLLLFPLAGLLYFSLRGVIEKRQVQANMETLETLSTLAVKLSAVVHETQKERGMSALYLGSKGGKFGDKLQAQRVQSDQAITRLQEKLKGIEMDRFGPRFKESLQRVSDLLRM